MYKNKFLFPVLCVSMLMFFLDCNTDNRGYGYTSAGANKALSTKICTKKILKFADALLLDTSKNINKYFSDDKFPINECNFKNIRDDVVFKTSIILIILKLHKYQLQRGQKDKVLLYPFQSMSTFAANVVNEYALLLYGKEMYYDETLFVSSVMTYIKRYPSLLKSPSLNKEYKECLFLTDKP
ncbi:hypothetical protein [Pedobacter helvus]|uniref:Lipoprotein n=1 Tax=Pedobacter helvus TaxID=2563444 RepID=A0ABW9JES2_9SPHI|nr:hypothetical protein [Pedobacter ureilyticus]